MAMTSQLVGRTQDGRGIWRHTETGGANAILTASKVFGVCSRILGAYCRYSAAPTQAGVTFAIDSGAGALFDHLISTGTANAQHSLLLASALFIGDDDAFPIVAPAGGVGITASVSVYTEDQKIRQ